jgi:hypothetical protein
MMIAHRESSRGGHLVTQLAQGPMLASRQHRGKPQNDKRTHATCRVELASALVVCSVTIPVTGDLLGKERFCTAGGIRRKFTMRHTTLLGGTAAGALATILLVPALAQRDTTPALSGAGTARTAFNPATLPEQQIGEKFTVKAEDLPPPKTGPVVASRCSLFPTRIKNREHRTDSPRQRSRPGSSIRVAC